MNVNLKKTCVYKVMNYKGDIIDNTVIVTLEKYIDILTNHEIKLKINDVCNVKHRIKTTNVLSIRSHVLIEITS